MHSHRCHASASPASCCPGWQRNNLNRSHHGASLERTGRAGHCCRRQMPVVGNLVVVFQRNDSAAPAASVEAGRRPLGTMNGSRQREATVRWSPLIGPLRSAAVSHSSAVARGQWRLARTSQATGRKARGQRCVRLKKEQWSYRAGGVVTLAPLEHVPEKIRWARPERNRHLHSSFVVCANPSKDHRGTTAPLLPFRSRLPAPLLALLPGFRL